MSVLIKQRGSSDRFELDVVVAAADELAGAEARFHAAMREARRAGFSLREIAEAAEVSPETVRKIVAPVGDIRAGA